MALRKSESLRLPRRAPGPANIQHGNGSHSIAAAFRMSKPRTMRAHLAMHDVVHNQPTHGPRVWGLFDGLGASRAPRPPPPFLRGLGFLISIPDGSAHLFSEACNPVDDGFGAQALKEGTGLLGENQWATLGVQGHPRNLGVCCKGHRVQSGKPRAKVTAHDRHSHSAARVHQAQDVDTAGELLRNGAEQTTRMQTKQGTPAQYKPCQKANTTKETH